jgi:hypothetical protein
VARATRIRVARLYAKHVLEIERANTAVDQLRLMHQLGVRLYEHGFDVAREARAEGATWREIGDALEMTRQAAQRRYGAFVAGKKKVA